MMNMIFDHLYTIVGFFWYEKEVNSDGNETVDMKAQKKCLNGFIIQTNLKTYDIISILKGFLKMKH